MSSYYYFSVHDVVLEKLTSHKADIFSSWSWPFLNPISVSDITHSHK